MSIDPGSSDELALIGYEKLTDHGFALPCFGQARGANTLYLARSSHPGDPSAPIAGFELYESEGAQLLPPDKERHGIRTGATWVDVFLWRGEIYVGTKLEIWLALGNLRREIEVTAPLSLLNLAEGVPGEATDELARAAFAWLEQRRGSKLAADWQLETHLRGIAIRNLRRQLGDAVTVGSMRQELRHVELDRNGSTLTLRLPAAINKAARITPATLGELVAAAGAFGFQIVVAESIAPGVEKPATAPIAADKAVLVMRLRKGRGGTQTQIPFRVVDTFLKGVTNIRSGHSGATRAMTQSSSDGSRNTMKLQVPELKHIRAPVARIERTAEAAVYHVYDAETPQGREIVRLLEAGRRNGSTHITSAGPDNGTWWRVV